MTDLLSTPPPRDTSDDPLALDTALLEPVLTELLVEQRDPLLASIAGGLRNTG